MVIPAKIALAVSSCTSITEYTNPKPGFSDNSIEIMSLSLPNLIVKYLEEENIRAQQILSGEDEILDDEMEIEEEDELSEEELDKKLRELNL